MGINPKRKAGFSFEDFMRDASKPPKKVKQRKPTKSRYKGKTKRMTLSSYLSAIFHYNERATQGKRACDARIAEMVLDEYSLYKDKFDLWREKPVERVIFYRNAYNKGTLTKGMPPVKLSYRYNLQGELITSKNSDQLTHNIAEHILEQRAYYTAHMIMNPKTPKAAKDLEWAMFEPTEEEKPYLKEAISKIKVRAKAMKKRHVEAKAEGRNIKGSLNG
jgi:hypothetical protein